MSYIDLITGLGGTLGTLKSLATLASTITNVETRIAFNNEISDLQSQILAARQQMLEIQERYEGILRENQELKDAALRQSSEKPTLKWGCYQFPGEPGLFCPACYDTKGKRHQTSRLNTRLRRCTVCQAEIGS